MKFKFLFLLFIVPSCLFSEVSLEKEEIILDSLLQKMRSASSFEGKMRLNIEFKTAFKTVLKNPISFEYPFNKLKSIGVVDSPDKKIRIINWNICSEEHQNFYYGFIIQKVKKNKFKVFDLIDNADQSNIIPESYVSTKKWYGCLYYKIIPKKKRSKTTYTLLGWDGKNNLSNYKLIDVLSFYKGMPVLGYPMFKTEDGIKKRIVFEYSDKAVMMLKFEKKYRRIIFDHLSPETPSLEGVYSFYVPDFSYDCYNWRAGYWNINTDIIGINKKGNRKIKIYGQNRKGKLKSTKISNEWVTPEDYEAPIDNQKHVARTPKSENQIIKNEKEKKPKKVKIKSKRRRRKTDNPLYPSSIYGNSYKMKRQR